MAKKAVIPGAPQVPPVTAPAGDSLLAPLPPTPAPAAPPTGPPPPAPVPSGDTTDGPGDASLFEPAPLNMDLVEGRETVTPVAPTPAPAHKPEQLSAEEIARRREENSNLRTQLEEANRTRTERETELAAERARIAGIEAERERFRTEKESVATEFQSLRQSLAQIDPMKDDRVIAINRQFDASVNSLAEEITDDGGEGKTLRGMVPALLKTYKSMGSPESAGYDEKRKALNDSIEESFPNHAKEIRTLLRNGVQLQDEMQERIVHLSKNGDKVREEREREQFMVVETAYSQREKKFFNPAPEVIENDPFNAEVIATQILDSSEEAKGRKKQILAFCRQIALPPAPMDAEQLSKMTLEEQNRFFESRNQNRIKYHDRMQNLLPIALASQVILPGIYKELVEARKQLAELRGQEPPPPNGENDQEADQLPATIKEFTPSNSALAAVQ